LLAVVCGGAIWGLSQYRARNRRPAALLARLPTRDAVVLYIDFAALRQGGVLTMLTGKGVEEEPEYRVFVNRTSFNYKEDLDSALIAFAPQAKYFLLRGRFDWTALRKYALGENGFCKNTLCDMAGSTRERQISFFPLQSDIMALAVSPQSSAAVILQQKGPETDTNLPDAPVWLSLPPAALRSSEALPAGTRMFARSMQNAEGVTLSLGPDGPRFAARLTVRCRNAGDAAEVASQLSRTTAMLRDMIARERQTPNPADLSGVLTSGSFRNEGTRVLGYWPIERSFVENLLSGGTS
jgi:hypothetical protein